LDNDADYVTSMDMTTPFPRGPSNANGLPGCRTKLLHHIRFDHIRFGEEH